jgi:hypothetical protein
MRTDERAAHTSAGAARTARHTGRAVPPVHGPPDPVPAGPTSR